MDVFTCLLLLLLHHSILSLLEYWYCTVGCKAKWVRFGEPLDGQFIRLACAETTQPTIPEHSNTDIETKAYPSNVPIHPPRKLKQIYSDVSIQIRQFHQPTCCSSEAGNLSIKYVAWIWVTNGY